MHPKVKISCLERNRQKLGEPINEFFVIAKKRRYRCKRGVMLPSYMHHAGIVNVDPKG